MNITKYGHCCLLIEEGEAKILLDPGAYNDTPVVIGVDAIFITHEHQDHCETEQIKEILSKNPDATIYTHEGVGTILDGAGIAYTNIEDREEVSIKGVTVASMGREHAVVYETMPRCRNTGYMIANRLFFPGDALYNPGVPVEILALPLGGPWMKFGEAIDYAKDVKPKVIFPVHDAMHIDEYRTSFSGRVVSMLLEPEGIACREIANGDTDTF